MWFHFTRTRVTRTTCATYGSIEDALASSPSSPAHTSCEKISMHARTVRAFCYLGHCLCLFIFPLNLPSLHNFLLSHFATSSILFFEQKAI